MRCQPGDLAVIVNGATANVGKLVHVVEQSSAYGPGWWLVTLLGGTAQGQFPGGAIGPAPGGSIQDNRLRPLRDQDGTDEVLRIAQRTA